MDEIINVNSSLLPGPLRTKWSQFTKQIDYFAISDWPGEAEDTSLYCNIAIMRNDVTSDEATAALIPYTNTGASGFYDIYEYEQDNSTTEYADESSTDYADSLDKGVALASGLISGIIDILFVGEFSIEKAKQYGEKDVENIVKKTAQKFGYKGNDIKGAIEYLEKKFPLAADSKIDDFGGAKQHHLWDFTHHFSIFGLLCSILTQFTGKVIGTNKEGFLSIRDVSDSYLIGKNFTEKILFGTVIWFFHMVSDMAGSSYSIGRGTGIPGPIVSLLKSLSTLPFFRNAKIGEVEFHTWVSKLFNGTLLAKRDANGKILEPVPFDLRMEIGILHEGSKQLLPVLINEAIVRSFYLIRRTHREIVKKNIISLKEITKIDPQNILPFNNHVIRRMCTIASGVFCAVDMIDAIIHSIIDQNPKTIFLHLNFVGIARFIVAIGVEAAAYLKETQIDREKAAYRKFRLEQEMVKLDWFTLTSEQTRVLVSLERQTCLYDIDQTTDRKARELKSQWLSAWMDNTKQNLRIPTDNASFFLEKDEIFEQFAEVYKASDEERILLIVLEAICFQPYFPASEHDVEKYKNIHLDHHYMETVFLQHQHIVSRNGLFDLKAGYNWYYDLLSGKVQMRWIVGLGTAALAALSGGLALHFAPAIAISLVGNTALHGAALASFSLAAIGGGALAVGGLGMAGGTLIIAGGGGLIGLLGGATLTSMATTFLLESDGYVLNECSKLIGYCDKVLLQQENAYSKIIELAKKMRSKIDYLDLLTQTMKRDLSGIREQHEKQEQENKVKVAEKSIRYLTDTSKHLIGLAERIPKENR